MISQAELTQSPLWFPHNLAGPENALSMVALDEAAYEAASFLDDRILTPAVARENLPWVAAQTAAASLSGNADFIFHIGHVGSTLLSRLLGAYPGVFSLREPAVLRTVSQMDEASRAQMLNVLIPLLSRRWRSDQHTLIKATSVASVLASSILDRPEAPRAILMFANPLAYLRGILAGPNSRQEAQALGPARLARLNHRLDAPAWRWDDLSEGERVASAWLSEMTALHDAWSGREDRVLWLNFDAFLQAPTEGLAAAFRHLGHAPSNADIEAIATGPLMGRYSKAPEHAYDAQLRQEVLLSAEREHGLEIRRGMDWLGRAATQHPLARAVLETSARQAGARPAR